MNCRTRASSILRIAALSLGCWLGSLGPSFADDHHVSSNTVKKTQTELKQKGYYDGEVDGVLGAQTRASLRRYQKEKGLAGDGRLTHETADPPGRRRARAIRARESTSKTPALRSKNIMARVAKPWEKAPRKWGKM